MKSAVRAEAQASKASSASAPRPIARVRAPASAADPAPDSNRGVEDVPRGQRRKVAGDNVASVGAAEETRPLRTTVPQDALSLWNVFRQELLEIDGLHSSDSTRAGVA